MPANSYSYRTGRKGNSAAAGLPGRRRPLPPCSQSSTIADIDILSVRCVRGTYYLIASWALLAIGIRLVSLPGTH